jgi:hypothetical protein
MKRSLSVLALMLCASAALAEPPADDAQRAASELVNKQLLAPLQKAESRRSRFSRAAPVAVERRVRVLDRVALTDARGRQFVRFAIDERRLRGKQSPWAQASVVGCAYPGEREVFVRRGKGYLPARSLLGADEQERADVCRAAPGAAGQLAAR